MCTMARPRPSTRMLAPYHGRGRPSYGLRRDRCWTPGLDAEPGRRAHRAVSDTLVGNDLPWLILNPCSVLQRVRRELVARS